MTNPAAAIRMLITYAICIPAALLVGFLLTNPLDYGTLGFLAFILAVLISPVFIKWHYPIMVFSLSLPASLFFLPGRPPAWQVGVLLSLGIAIVERALSSKKQFLSVPSMTWPVVFMFAVVLLTAELTGGFGFRQLGGDKGGGAKYLALFLDLALYFALTSRRIPLEDWKLYTGLLILSATPAIVGDLFPFLPSPLNYINLLIPPSAIGSAGVTFGVTRLGALSTTATALVLYLLARHGLRGTFDPARPWRGALFLVMLGLTLFGGFRSNLISILMLMTFLFFLEGLHRTRVLMVVMLGAMLAAPLMVSLARHMPYTVQRSLAMLPMVDVDPQVKIDAEGSSEWRKTMWRDLWPKVPQYLLLGKGFLLTAEDFQMMGTGTFAGRSAHFDASTEGLAISGDYHNGPLSTLVPFGIWGALGFLWITLAGLRVLYRNYKYGDPALRTINGFLLLWYLQRYITFFFVFGGLSLDLGLFLRTVGLSIALNGGMLGSQPKPVFNPRIKPLPAPAPAAQTV